MEKSNEVRILLNTFSVIDNVLVALLSSRSLRDATRLISFELPVRIGELCSMNADLQVTTFKHLVIVLRLIKVTRSMTDIQIVPQFCFVYNT